MEMISIKKKKSDMLKMENMVHTHGDCRRRTARNCKEEDEREKKIRDIKN